MFRVPLWDMLSAEYTSCALYGRNRRYSKERRYTLTVLSHCTASWIAHRRKGSRHLKTVRYVHDHQEAPSRRQQPLSLYLIKFSSLPCQTTPIL
jgi:hypothetical protein